MKQINRRRFLKTSLLTTTSIGLAPTLTGCATEKDSAARTARLRVRGANEDIRVAVVGFNGRGESHINGFREIKGVRLVALCDVDRDVLEKGVRKSRDRGDMVEGYTDFRKLLENPDIDVVSVATPNHWHALNAVWAAQAGKDVYLEKPVSHNVWEGRQAVEAARKYGRMVQTGSQARSSQAIAEAIDWIRAGNLGKIVRARGFCYKRRASIGNVTEPQPIPGTIDYDLWCGPAEKEPLMRKRLHYDWHWVWPTGNGDLGNQGVHQVDIARWALGEDALSPQVLSIGGRLGYEDDGTTPNTLISFYDYERAPLIFEVRGLPVRSGSNDMDKYQGVSIGNIIECEGGSMIISNSYSGAVAFDNDGKEIRKFQGGGNHFENFINAVRSRKHTDLTADILEGHLSAALCHVANISCRVGETESPEKIREKIKGDKDVVEAFGRMQKHLAANEVDLRKTPLSLGAALKIDPKRERFTNSGEANKLLTRNYRKPFVVPEKV